MADDLNIAKAGQQQQPGQQGPPVRQPAQQQQSGVVRRFGDPNAPPGAQPIVPGFSEQGLVQSGQQQPVVDQDTGVPGLYAPTLSQHGRTPQTVVDALVRLGYVGALALEAAVAQAQVSGITPEQVLLGNQTITTDQLARATAEKFGLDYIDLSLFELDFQAAAMITPDDARRYEVLPVRQYEDGSYLVAMANPANVLALDDLRLKMKTELRPAVVAPDDLAGAFARMTTLDDAVSDAFDDDDDFEGDVTQLDVRETAEDAPVVKLINSILVQAVTLGASDLHFEPEGREMRVRFRVDGVLQRATTVPRRMVGPTISRLKIMADMDISERRIPQDGRVGLRIGGLAVDLRVVTTPAVHGEKVVIRVLDKTSTQMSMEDLGLSPSASERFVKGFMQPYGAVFVTGPTGSGKTTSLYAALNTLNTIEKNIITIEDPVEYQIQGLTQMQVNVKAGLTFSTGLRSMLRADPDIIMVGEIRDAETAQIAIESALTGHMVLSTLHTNDAPTAVTRLTEMGVEPFLTASALEVVMSQRLARKLCAHCARPIRVTAEQLQASGFDADEDIDAMEAVGCPRCSHGYRGRIGLYEVMVISDEIRTMVIERTSATQIAEVAKQSGMLTLRQDGLKKIAERVTTVEEIARVTGTSGA